MSGGNIEVEQGSGNVYADLGVPNAEKMLVRARLAANISEIIKHRHLTHGEAADIIGLPQPKLLAILRGQFRGISESELLGCLNKLG